MSNQFFKTRKETKSWLDKMGVENYFIHADMTVDVVGDVDISGNRLKYIPVQFGDVDGNFSCGHNLLVNLSGAPHVCGDFYCYDNKLTNLTGAPRDCMKIDCSDNLLLYDISAGKKCPDLDYDHDVVAKNQAARQLAALDDAPGLEIPSGKRPRPGRVL